MNKNSNIKNTIIEILSDGKEYTFNNIYTKLNERYEENFDRKRMSNLMHRFHKANPSIIMVRKGVYRLNKEDATDTRDINERSFLREIIKPLYIEISEKLNQSPFDKYPDYTSWNKAKRIIELNKEILKIIDE